MPNKSFVGRLLLFSILVVVLLPLFSHSMQTLPTNGTEVQGGDLPALADWKIPRRALSFAFGIIGAIIGVWAANPKTKPDKSRALDMAIGGFTAALFITNTRDATEILSHAVAMGAMWQTVFQGFFKTVTSNRAAAGAAS